jgi:transcriptional regulator with XRE-family HTH domain
VLLEQDFGGLTMARELTRELDAARKMQLISILTNDLKVLRAKVGISQKELATRMGISRQTYGAIENKKHHMTGTHFLTLILLLGSNDNSAKILYLIGAYPPELEDYIQLNERA